MWIAAAASGCAAAPPALAEQQRTVIIGTRPIELHLFLQPQHTAHAARYFDAAHGVLQRLSDWLGPYPHERLAIFDLRVGAILGVHPASVIVPARRFEPMRSRALEVALIRAIAAHYWDTSIDTTLLGPSGLASALQRFTATRAVDEMYGAQRLYEEDFFAGFVPYVIRSVPVHGLNGDARRDTYSSALATLERSLGWPVMQQALQLFFQRWQSRRPAPEDFFATVEEVAHRDLRWFFNDAFQSAHVFDYGIEELSSMPHPTSPDRFVTSVVVRRYGDGVFSGTARAESGPFESGRGVELLVRFGSGETLRDFWDGRAQTKTFSYESGTRADFARVDPDEILAVDADRSNNMRALNVTMSSRIVRWAFAWTAWLQNAMLTYAPLL